MLTRSVLHVLPHPGGGGETYVDSLDAMPNYRFERFYLTQVPSLESALRSLPRNIIELQREARKHDLIHVEGEVASALCLPSLATRPSVVTLNGLHLLRRLTSVRRRIAKANLRLMLASASRIICVSESERRDFNDAVGGRRTSRVVLIRNGVASSSPPTPDERHAARAEYGLSPETTVAAWLAGLDQHKDPLTAVRASIEVARTGAPFVLVMAGDGPLRSMLEQVAAESGTEAVRVIGFSTNARQVIAAADFFVLTSQREGLSFSLLEAMSAGLPAVVSDGPGNPDAVGDTGIVVPFGDVDGFADAFSSFASDVATRRELGQRARQRVDQRFRVDEMVRLTERVYDSVLSERARP
jgi:glycosyltransferase involved in cell wall biosynthesis